MQSFDYIQKYQNAKNAKEFSACAGPCVRISVAHTAFVLNHKHITFDDEPI